MKMQTVTLGSDATKAHRAWLPLAVGACLSAAVASTTATAASAQVGNISGGAPTLLTHATDLGPVSRSTAIDVTVWLKLHDNEGLDNTLATQQGGHGVWLSDEQIRARHAPTSADVAAVKDFLKAQ